MKHVLYALLGLALLATACKKDTIEKIDDPIIVMPTDSVATKGQFVSNAHATSGSVKLVIAANGNKYLAFENFSTDAGPDLRIYLAKDKNATQFTELTNDVKNGTYSLDIPGSTNTDNQKFVLVWCKQFSVLFGHAELK